MGPEDSNNNDTSSSDKETQRPPIYIIADQIMSKYDFVTTQNHSIWYYTDGYYRPDGENLIRIAARRIGSSRREARSWQPPLTSLTLLS